MISLPNRRRRPFANSMLSHQLESSTAPDMRSRSSDSRRRVRTADRVIGKSGRLPIADATTADVGNRVTSHPSGTNPNSDSTIRTPSWPGKRKWTNHSS